MPIRLECQECKLQLINYDLTSRESGSKILHMEKITSPKTNKVKAVKILCNLDKIAKERGLKPYDIADMSGLSVPTIYDVMSNHVSPSMETLSKLASALGVTHADLLRTEVI